MNRRERGRLRFALLTSAALHAGVVLLVWVASSRAAELPKMRVYAVDIVSPPPRQLGEWSPEPAGEPEPEETTPAEPEPEAKPEPTPEPPRVEPSPPPRATKKPEEPKPAPPKPAPTETRKTEPPKPAPRESKPAETPSRGQPSTGANPDPTSTGGEDLNVKIEGARFLDPDYLANIQRQINRYFRRPSGSTSDMAEVRFWINRDGSVSDIELVSSRGSFAFRSAAMEAVEQAGLNKAFGPLPKAYPADRLAVSFYFRPAR